MYGIDSFESLTAQRNRKNSSPYIRFEIWPTTVEMCAILLYWSANIVLLKWENDKNINEQIVSYFQFEMNAKASVVRYFSMLIHLMLHVFQTTNYQQ